LTDTAILSPHLDDAVLSCWHALTSMGEVAVINMFAAIPARDHPLSWWDRVTGATDSAARMRERLAEDQRALALAGRRAVNLEFLDDQYRGAHQPLDQIVAELRCILAPTAVLLAPAGIGGHPDHLLVRAAALTLRENGFAVALYAELPHAIRNGWPQHIDNGSRRAPADNAEIEWEQALDQIDGAVGKQTVHALSARTHTKKLEAIHTYRTQVDALDTIAYQSLDDADTLRYEVVWELV
jgi:LmbE family N-acetylglucosaminyl deacetylase